MGGYMFVLDMYVFNSLLISNAGCIDKRSSAELSEAINSMFCWYASARVCYAYLSDVEEKNSSSGIEVNDQLRESRWFTRGWTLQELIAPTSVQFYDKQWLLLGEKKSMVPILNEITGINENVLENHHWLRTTCVAQKMSWAAQRTTSRVEDQAYSLLGIFNVNMPMLYGEGEKAYQRLQEEIIKSSSEVDHSILAWANPSSDPASYIETPNLLALSPEWFRHAQGIISWALPQSEIFEISQRGLRLTAPVKDDGWLLEVNDEKVHAIALNCRYQHKPSSRIVLSLLQRPHVEELNWEGRYQSPDVEEISYDRISDDRISHLRKRNLITTDPLVSVDASAVQGADWTRGPAWTKRTFTITRQSFAYPAHGDRVHVELNSCRTSPNSPERYKLDREQMLPLLRVDGTDLRSDWNGHFTLEVRKPGATSYADADVDVTSVHIEIRHDFDEDNGFGAFSFNRPPYLYLRTWDMGTRAHLRDPIFNGETRVFPATRGYLNISARYVNLVDKFLWSIRITPIISDDDEISE
jgi:hypothetical protein